MAEPLDRDAEQSSTPNSDGSDPGYDEDELDIDTLVSIWRDDLLLDAIGATSAESDELDVPFDVAPDRRLIEALLSWRRENEPDLITSAPPDHERHAEVDAPASSVRRPRFRVPVVSTLAAAVVVAFTAMAAYGAAPDEPLWPITEVLYSQHAESVRAAHDVRADQAQARAAIAAGQLHDANAALHAAAGLIPQVHNDDGRTELQNRQRDLAGQLTAAPTATTAKRPTSKPAAPQHNGSANPTSPDSEHSPQPESSSDRARENHDSAGQFGSATTTPPTRPSAQPASEPPTSPQHHEQSAKPPRPTRSADATTTQPPTSDAQTSTKEHNPARKVEQADPGAKKSPPDTPQKGPEATKSAASAEQALKPHPAIPPKRNRPSHASPSTPDAQTPQQDPTPPPSAPS